MDHIGKRLNQEYQFNASIHGIDLKTPTVTDHSEVELNEAQKATIKTAQQQRLEEIRKRHGGF